jgi:hypothetical protein
MYLDKGYLISEGWFRKHVFLTLCPVKIYIYPKSCIRNACVELYKNLGKVVKIGVFM